MTKSSFDAIARTLRDAGVPFIVVGGIAVIHHGYGRTTQDVDLVIKLEREVILRAFAALGRIGYRPVVPIAAEDFADPVRREEWRREKRMTVLRFWSDTHPDTPVDIFADEPFDFARELSTADCPESTPGLAVPIVSLHSLLKMKRAASRPQDLADIDELNLLHEAPSSYDAKS